MKLILRNIGRNRIEAWRHVMYEDADIALLQDANEPADSITYTKP